MKYNSLLIALAAVALLTACQKKETEREKLDGRTVSPLSVQYEMNGQAVQSLLFTKGYSRSVLQVNVNDAGLLWNLESNCDWCTIVPDTHKGSGPVTLEIAANGGLDPRETATLTFTAGDFKGFRINVDQSGSSFSIDRSYLVSKPLGNVFYVEVTTLEDLDWNVTADDWITVNRQAPVPGAVSGQVKTTLQLTVASDFDDSRLGTIALNSDNEKDFIRVWQFGSEMETQGDDILLPYEENASFDVVVPRSQIRSVDKPDFAAQRSERIDDILDRLTFSLTKNFSDLNEPRPVPVYFTLGNDSIVYLPSIKQKYLPAGGLMTAEGLQAFAAKVAAGESTSDWEKDGWVTVLQDIDMTGVTDWAGIGTSSHPFSGKFDGANHSIINFKKAASGIFNNCAGESAENTVKIKNLHLAESNSFEYSASGWTGNAFFGGIVNQAVNTEITGCTSNATFKMGGSSEDEASAWFGCILGKGGAGTSVSGCEMSPTGKMTVTSSGGADAVAFIGGIAGEAPSLRECKMAGSIEINATINDVYVGGISSSISSESNLYKNTFSGELNLNDSGSSNVYLGGLYAFARSGCNLSFDKSDDRSVISGSILVNNYKNSESTRVFAGGFLGYALQNVTLSFKDYEISPKFLLYQPADDKKVSYFCFGGILGGCNPEAKVTKLTFDGITTSGRVAFKYVNKSWSITRGNYAGIAGYVNGPADFTGCSNEGPIGALLSGSIVNPARSQGSSNRMGGIAGYAEGGNVTFTSCHNRANVINAFYTNYPFYATSGNYYFNATLNGMFCGGILGAFDFNTSVGSNALTVSGCDNTGSVDGLRGVVGGIVGYCQNATISACSNTGVDNSVLPEYYADKNEQICFQQGGIVGTMRKGTINNCTAKWFIHAAAPGSAEFAVPGGILGRAYTGDPVNISNCKFYGTVQALSTAMERYPGGIVGFGLSNTVVSDCAYGGSLIKAKNDKTEKIEVKIETDVDAAKKENVFGNNTGTISGTITFWPGSN